MSYFYFGEHECQTITDQRTNDHFKPAFSLEQDKIGLFCGNEKWPSIIIQSLKCILRLKNYAALGNTMDSK